MAGRSTFPPMHDPHETALAGDQPPPTVAAHGGELGNLCSLEPPLLARALGVRDWLLEEAANDRDGGRVLAVVALGEDLADARARAYEEVARWHDAYVP